MSTGLKFFYITLNMYEHKIISFAKIIQSNFTEKQKNNTDKN